MSMNLMLHRGPSKVCFLEDARYFRNMVRMSWDSPHAAYASPTEHYIKLVNGMYTIYFIKGPCRPVPGWHDGIHNEFLKQNWVELPGRPELTPRPDGWEVPS